MYTLIVKIVAFLLMCVVVTSTILSINIIGVYANYNYVLKYVRKIS